MYQPRSKNTKAELLNPLEFLAVCSSTSPCPTNIRFCTTGTTPDDEVGTFETREDGSFSGDSRARTVRIDWSPRGDIGSRH